MSEYHFDLEQGSYDWHQLRAGRDTASQASAVLEVCPDWMKPKNQRELFAVKNGDMVVEINEYAKRFMARGKDLEPAARALANKLADRVFLPCTVVRGTFLASMDGLTNNGKTGCEIKIPKDEDSDLFERVTKGDLPPYYLSQIVQQFHVCDEMERLLYLVYDPGDPANSAIYWFHREEVILHWPEIEKAWATFHSTNHPPVEIEVESDEWKDLALQYRSVKALADEYKASADVLAKELKALADNPNCPMFGAGVRVTPVTISAKPAKTTPAKEESHQLRLTTYEAG